MKKQIIEFCHSKLVGPEPGNYEFIIVAVLVLLAVIAVAVWG